MQAALSTSSKAFVATPVVAVARPTRAVSRAARVECSAANKKRDALVAGVTVGVAAIMANPLVAEAAVTPSLKNLLNSVVAGGVVLGVIAVAVSGVSSFDQIRK